ncbi:MAG: HAMP domain-containing sensor histidine kinase [Bacteroidales bacterium]|jgi:signal transduction histidine kinase|nr:HAMP domain-containing sensor histidine kinase [Bacteroidales bacterium]MDD3152876.1 HAMP domain-containing sensor histidine kinase [Bacteroidales bacterium]MDD3913530.1 HAMP domain-containing sensor histidine kinase [Bacteroidales bacterium]MDD4634159.1 HAMP domain-containing sensor histidine kinase [Bacteroidales bacterium]
MKYRRKLYTYFFITFVIFLMISVFVQTNKEKRYQTNTQKEKLDAYANIVENYLLIDTDTAAVLNLLPENIRLTIIDEYGNLLFDNVVADKATVSDHTSRPEIIAARATGKGSAIRLSESTNVNYLYLAIKTPDNSYIRVSLPYKIKLSDTFKTDSVLMYAALLLFLIAILMLLYTSDKFGKVMSTLKKFAANVEKGQVDYETVTFPDTDSGEIGSKIISIYRQLETSKQQTDFERDKNRMMKQEMTNNIAHELKTPVCSIRGYLETILTNPNVDKDTQSLFLNRAYNQSVRLTELIDDVTLINKIEDASFMFTQEKLIISNIFDEVLEEFAARIAAQNVTALNKIPLSVEVAGNHSLLFAAFRNLVDNSLKYAGDSIEICAECYAEDDKNYFFKYYDTGCGVDEKFLDKIFDRFVRIDEGRTRKDGGSGLGLAIVKHSIAFHGGQISARNRETGGLEFLFNLQNKPVIK